MQIAEQSCTIFGHHLKYKFRTSKKDCSTLIVIFSGFGQLGYDFDGDSLNYVPANILWIKDEVDSLGPSYYICIDNDFSINKSIIGLIEKIADEVKSDKKDIVLLGASKGGTAALYYGMKYNFHNIILSAPQYRLGTFLSKQHQNILRRMCKSDFDSDYTVKYFDDLMKNIVESNKNLDKNIFLFCSQADEYENGKALASDLNKFKNFNCFNCTSNLVEKHNQVTQYSLPLILSILYSLSYKINPKYGRILNFGGEIYTPEESLKILNRQVKAKEVVARLLSAQFNDSRFFPSGIGFVRGVPSERYGKFKKELILENVITKKRKSFLVGSTEDLYCSYNCYKDVYCNYRTAGFATIKHQGIDLRVIENCTYKLLFSVNGIIGNLTYSKDSKVAILSGGGIVRIFNHGEETRLQILCPISPIEPDIFEIRDFRFENSVLFLDGIMVKYGIMAENWSDLNFFLVLEGNNEIKTFPYAKNDLVELNKLFDGNGFYRKFNFTSVRNQGLNLSELKKGRYNIYVSCLTRQGAFFTKRINQQITVN